eukprot:11628995-Heterocapsa_arctica.AAC.1
MGLPCRWSGLAPGRVPTGSPGSGRGGNSSSPKCGAACPASANSMRRIWLPPTGASSWSGLSAFCPLRR